MSQIFEIFPQAITLYPNDRQTFTGRAGTTPPLWKGVTSGKILSDFSLALNPSGDSFVEGFCAQALYSGIGYAEILIEDNSRPTSTGYIQLQSTIVTDTGTYGYLVQIKATEIKIYNEVATLLATITYSVVTGDRFKLQLASGWRLYRNGVFLHERISLSGSVRYPMGFGVAIVKPVAGSLATVHRPDLTGDWRLLPEITFTTPSHGSLSTTGPALATDYFGGVQPGVYTLVGQIAPTPDVDDLQVASATITIPPIEILGGDVVTIQPSAKARFKTNYDAAQTSLVTWSVISGSGSFSGGEFTAPSSPGTTVVRASNSANTSVAEITITIPATITAAIGSMSVTAAQASEAITLVANMSGSVTWSASCGTISPGGAGATKTWTAPSITGQRCKITATNGTLTKIIEIPVLKKFAYDPSNPITWDRRKTVTIAQSEDRTRTSRVKDKNGTAFEAFELTFTDRDTTELAAVHSFWDEHYPGQPFILQDAIRSKRLVGYFDSDIRNEVDGSCAISYSFRFAQSNLSL